MKIIFNKLQTSKETIQVSLDGGTTWNSYVVSEIIESGIPLDENQDYEKIRIKGPANVLKNLDVLSSINTLYESNLLPEDITGLVLKDFNGTFDKSLLQKYPNLANVTVPNSVTSIGDYAFYDCKSLTSVTIPDSVTKIGDSAFNSCSNLTNIAIPDSVTKIGGSAFSSCSNLTSITIPDSVTEIGSFALSFCSNLTNIAIPSSVTKIDDATFNACYSLTSITIPEGVTEIGASAFSSCSNLTNIAIPSSVTFIGISAFYGCRKLTNIKVDENNQNYSTSEDGKVLFNKDKTTLIDYPSASGDYVIPNSVTSIGKRAFFSTNLTSVIIPSSVTSIGEDAFYHCSKLKTINYIGTQEQWEVISKGTDWNRNCPSDMEINYDYQG